MTRVVIPVTDENGEVLHEHFGRAPYYAWFDIDDSELVDSGVVPNDSEHFGGTGYPPERINDMGGDVVITLGMGIRAIRMFQDIDVAVLRSETREVEESLVRFINEELEELTEGCLHARKH
ncbi:MAG: NifB/NifX family molybdenum-iron cluster-binding protein [Candidatus Bathyarchaeia archaeon]